LEAIFRPGQPAQGLRPPGLPQRRQALHRPGLPAAN